MDQQRVNSIATRFTAALQRHLAARGLDLATPFAVQRYNAAVADTAMRLPTFSHPSSTLGVLVANSRALWPRFTAYIRRDPAHVTRGGPHPFDRFVALAVDESLALARAEAGVPEDVVAEVRGYQDPPPKMVAMQRLAHAAGLAHFDQACFLSVHAEFGPWIALRAAIVIDLPGPPDTPADPPNPVPAALPAHLARHLARLLPAGTSYHAKPVPAAAPSNLDTVPPLDGLDAPTRALVEQMHGPLHGDWRDWLIMRDVAAVASLGGEGARKARYEDEAVEYHYTKESHVLRGIIGEEAWRAAGGAA
ncbi:hypothetical protein H9P43_007100 [Blastocladiella emersonii ATCC 22665]|nr:hypothetical protein H9P43_007100 [Blastocladiella emersonii ATCC 22665]